MTSEEDLIFGTVMLSPLFKQCPDPCEVITKALNNAELNPNELVIMNIFVSYNDHASRIVKIAAKPHLVEEIKNKDLKIPAGMSEITFRFKEPKVNAPIEPVEEANNPLEDL